MSARLQPLQCHFHRPRDKRINGHQYEMVVHWVHKDLDMALLLPELRGFYTSLGALTTRPAPKVCCGWR
jgi:carbonic anhydrase